MSGVGRGGAEIRKLLKYGDLSFRDFVELALYHPEFGYYTTGHPRVGKGGDYVTAATLSPAFSFAIAGLFREFLGRVEAEVCSFVDIGTGDGSLIRAVASQIDHPRARFVGYDRSLSRVNPVEGEAVRFVSDLHEVPREGAHLVFSSELYDAFPFARLVQRGEHLHELWVAEREGILDWVEHEASPVYDDYFSGREIDLAEGQFADLSLEWEAFYRDVARRFERSLIVTLDYGHRDQKLFHPRARRFGTAAAYSGQRVHRDLLADPGEQDLTAHINFADLERGGEAEGASTLFYDVLAKFLLATGITEHELFRPVTEAVVTSAEEGLELMQLREDARRLILPDGIGTEQHVLVQARNVPVDGWSFQQKLF